MKTDTKDRFVLRGNHKIKDGWSKEMLEMQGHSLKDLTMILREWPLWIKFVPAAQKSLVKARKGTIDAIWNDAVRASSNVDKLLEWGGQGLQMFFMWLQARLVRRLVPRF